MTTFLLDIWHDLREKRLWPVAAALVAATLAVPVVVMKPADTSAPPAPPADAQPVSLPAVSPDQGIVDSSDLGTFDIKDPFGSQADRTAGSTPDGGSGAGGSSSDGGGSTGGGDPATGVSGPGGSAGGGGGSGGGSGGDGSGGGTRWFTYTVDLRFGPRDDFNAYKGVEQLALLPDDQNPIVSFMGMRDDAKTAVFFIVDPAFEADGEGDCQPTPEDCRFIYMGIDDDRDEMTLSAADGNLEFQLQLDKIHVKNLSASEATGDATPDATPTQRRQNAGQDNLLTAPLGSIR
jgi:hypothetical protein